MKIPDMKRIMFISIPSAMFLLIGSQLAIAYVGPGLGLGAIGTIIDVVFSVLLAIFAIFWYPIQRWLGIGMRVKPRVDQGRKDEP